MNRHAAPLLFLFLFQQIGIGLLGFIVFFGAGNIYEMIPLVKKGFENEFISHLAYSDGLTKVGNRTAYLEKLQHIAAAHAEDELALVMFDVNNLKYVNDTFGHKAGDDLLLACADVLTTAFPAPWGVYRIGGDEFLALRHKSPVHEAYTEAVTRFSQLIDHVNGGGERECSVAIAHGVAFLPSITAEGIEKAEREADIAMYQDKYRLKCLEQKG